MSGFDDVNEEADSLGGDWFKFNSIGETLKVKLVSMEVRDQRDFTTGEPKVTRKTGKVRKEWIVTGTNDQGDLIKCALKEGAQSACVAARNAAGATHFKPGGLLALQYTSENTPPGATFAFKEFRAQYAPPSESFNLEPPTAETSVGDTSAAVQPVADDLF